MILAVSRFRIKNGMEMAVAQAFLDRPHLVDDAPGFLGLEVFTDTADPSVFYLVTRWTDGLSFDAWHRSESHHRSHKWIPRGLRLDASFTQVTILERLPRPTPAPEDLLMDSAPLLAAFLACSETVHSLAATTEGIIVFANPAVSRHLGLPADGALGKSLWHLLSTADAARLRATVASGERRPSERTRLTFLAMDHVPYILDCHVDTQPNGLVILGELSRRP